MSDFGETALVLEIVNVTERRLSLIAELVSD
jgi:hypothetical protein